MGLKIEDRIMLRPRFEGTNILLAIGFKHIMYLVEEAIIQSLRNYGYNLQFIYENYGLCLEVVDSDIRILSTMLIDDEVEAEVIQKNTQSKSEMDFEVRLYAVRENKKIKIASAKLSVLFRREKRKSIVKQTPVELDRFASDCINREKKVNGIDPEKFIEYVSKFKSDGKQIYFNFDHFQDGNGNISDIFPQNSNVCVWKYKIPYFYCHYSKRLQHSGYIRLMEESKNIFVKERGISIYTYLNERSWIPFVSKARIELVSEALMEEDIYIIYSVENIIKDFYYLAKNDFYVIRDGQLVLTATGEITHGYGKITGPCSWEFVNFDNRTLNAISNQENPS